MNYRKTLLAASIITGLCVGTTVFAQDSAPTPNDQSTTATTQSTAAQRQAEEKNATRLGTVMVTGIRGSQAESLNLKKVADAHVEVVTSEDIGSCRPGTWQIPCSNCPASTWVLQRR